MPAQHYRHSPFERDADDLIGEGRAEEDPQLAGQLVGRNVTVNGHRTSMRLEPATWDALGEIARREGKSINDLVSLVEAGRNGAGLTAAVRGHVLKYFRDAATEEGHRRVGHGPDRSLTLRYALAFEARRAAE